MLENLFQNILKDKFAYLFLSLTALIQLYGLFLVINFEESSLLLILPVIRLLAAVLDIRTHELIGKFSDNLRIIFFADIIYLVIIAIFLFPIFSFSDYKSIYFFIFLSSIAGSSSYAWHLKNNRLFKPLCIIIVFKCIAIGVFSLTQKMDYFKFLIINDGFNIVYLAIPLFNKIRFTDIRRSFAFIYPQLRRVFSTNIIKSVRTNFEAYFLVFLTDSDALQFRLISEQSGRVAGVFNSFFVFFRNRIYYQYNNLIFWKWFPLAIGFSLILSIFTGYLVSFILYVIVGSVVSAYVRSLDLNLYKNYFLTFFNIYIIVIWIITIFIYQRTGLDFIRFIVLFYLPVSLIGYFFYEKIYFHSK